MGPGPYVSRKEAFRRQGNREADLATRSAAERRRLPEAPLRGSKVALDSKVQRLANAEIAALRYAERMGLCVLPWRRRMEARRVWRARSVLPPCGAHRGWTGAAPVGPHGPGARPAAGVGRCGGSASDAP